MKPWRSPQQLFGPLFEAVQAQTIFEDSKTFADAIPRSDPATIVARYLAQSKQKPFDLRRFVQQHFALPAESVSRSATAPRKPVVEHIAELWDYLKRDPEVGSKDSSLIPLPKAYIIPGGRFREVYYWDSYFAMLGLACSGRVDLIANTIENFAFLIDQIGFIPNGNRTYYCSRSQPPMFALMVELLAETTCDQSLLTRYLPQLEREYSFWMSGAEGLKNSGTCHRRVVKMDTGLVNRYWDDSDGPRSESYAEDMTLASQTDRPSRQLFRDIRAACESGWDFSSRWFEDTETLATVRTTQIVPVDLNAILYKLESVLSSANRIAGHPDRASLFGRRKDQRKSLIRHHFFDDAQGLFSDLCLPDFVPTGVPSLATAYPLFFGIATQEQADRVAERIRSDFLRPGGYLTTLNHTGQQWDAPNGWAPLQFIVTRGLRKYGFAEDARDGIQRWVDNNLELYNSHGRMFEKYDVMQIGRLASGGEYKVQDGFGWTNGVLSRFLQDLRG